MVFNLTIKPQSVGNKSRECIIKLTELYVGESVGRRV